MNPNKQWYEAGTSHQHSSYTPYEKYEDLSTPLLAIHEEEENETQSLQQNRYSPPLLDLNPSSPEYTLITPGQAKMPDVKRYDRISPVPVQHYQYRTDKNDSTKRHLLAAEKAAIIQARLILYYRLLLLGTASRLGVDDSGYFNNLHGNSKDHRSFKEAKESLSKAHADSMRIDKDSEQSNGTIVNHRFTDWSHPSKVPEEKVKPFLSSALEMLRIRPSQSADVNDEKNDNKFDPRKLSHQLKDLNEAMKYAHENLGISFRYYESS